MSSASIVLFSLVVVLLSKSVVSVGSGTPTLDDSLRTGPEYEDLKERMDKLQFSFMELFVHVKELGELVVNNQRMAEQNQLAHLREVREQVVSNQRTIEQTLLEHKNSMLTLEDRLSANVSLITSYSKQILDYQTICANHEKIRKELLTLKPNSTNIQGRPTTEAQAKRNSSPSFIHSCKEANSTTTGLFKLVGLGRTPFEVWCEMNKFGGGWLVIQRRFNGSVNFYRNWTEYRNGFGDVAGEFWLGLERIHQLTKAGTWELIVEFKDFADDYEYARYSEFALGNEWSKYTLSKLGTHSGVAGDALKYHKGMKFSTLDRDNDEDERRHCAEKYHGAWWYKSCYDSNLNGLYTENQDAKAIKWFETNDSLKYTSMMIRKI